MSPDSGLLPAMAMVWLGVGSNRGSSLATCRRLSARLLVHPHLKPLVFSSWYRSEPIGPGRQPWYINGVIGVRSRLPPQTLLRLLHRLEAASGRRRCQEKRWGPRRLDLDLLFYGQRIIHNRILQLPHPRLHRRRFVLHPLAEVAADWRHPQCGKTVDTLLKEVDDTARVVFLG
ncbi:MAG: 2-amino-4-hydroxy-6-hydroxymethyldihydropteridine diphosphokinase [Magnetococcales bacterium]|nr:2-amino-4-hydroxy-6-hydroxymethyldihydropteridine diphosphokinase [Magnetococcales bacterium]